MMLLSIVYSMALMFCFYNCTEVCLLEVNVHVNSCSHPDLSGLCAFYCCCLLKNNVVIFISLPLANAFLSAFP